MNTTQHTPGPWSNVYGKIMAKGETICILPPRDNNANADLMASAPDLLSALQSSADWLDELCGLIQSGMFDAASDWVGANAVSTDSTIRAAIAKAKGEICNSIK